jgi:ketosteroid isomerase-like protein
MLRPVRRLFVALLAGAALVGCGSSGPTDEEQVRDTVDAFSKATAAKDYDKLCKQLLAPKLLEQVDQAGLSCEVALSKGLEDVKDPKVTIGQITVSGDAATADVQTSASGEEPARDTLKLSKVGGRWRITSLG